MTLEEAIEFQEQYLRQPQTHIADILDDAIRLGTEALKREQWNRVHPAYPEKGILPSETYIPQSVGKLPSDEVAEDDL